jgi:hypothetical protein
MGWEWQPDEWDAPTPASAARWRPPTTTYDTLLSHLRRSPNGTIRVAVVGNGPLFERDRPRIEQYENIVRFNDMKNWRRNETVTLHAVRSEDHTDEFAYRAGLSRGHNSTIWALASEQRHVAADVDVVTWTYFRDREYKWFNENWQWIGFDHPKPQTLSPWKESLYLFPNCSACGAHRSHCKVRNTKYGPSAGAVVLNELDAMPEVDEIGVFGMNWANSHSWDHTDFKYPTLVSDCCSKCTIHSTPSGGYLPKGWIQKAEEGLSAAAAVGVGAVSTAGVAWAVAAAIGIKHFLHRRRSKKELAAAKAAHAEVMAKQTPTKQKQANVAAHAGAHMPLLQLA